MKIDCDNQSSLLEFMTMALIRRGFETVPQMADQMKAMQIKFMPTELIATTIKLRTNGFIRVYSCTDDCDCINHRKHRITDEGNKKVQLIVQSLRQVL